MTASSLKVPIQLKQSDRTIAHQLGQRSQPAKRQQIIQNTLAIYAAHNYLELLGIESDPTGSDLFNPSMQANLDTADLPVGNLGKLECRAIINPSDCLTKTSCPIPAEVCRNRIGYLMIELDEDLNKAEILGFAPEITENPFPLEKLSPVESLLDQLSRLS